MGKTSLALQYAARHERAYPRGVVCIDSQSIITIEASLQKYVSNPKYIKWGANDALSFLVCMGNRKGRRKL